VSRLIVNIRFFNPILLRRNSFWISNNCLYLLLHLVFSVEILLLKELLLQELLLLCQLMLSH